MQDKYDLYAAPNGDLDRAAQSVNSALHIQLEARESSYQGGDYFHHEGDDGEEITLKRNYDSFEDEWAEPEFKDAEMLLYVDESSRADDCRVALEGLGYRLLRREEM